MRLPTDDQKSNPTVRRHLESGTLDVRSADDQEIAAF
jgi:hypothetical protein